MTSPERMEKVAEALYRNEGGLTNEDYLQVHGVPRRAWKTDAPWDTNPNELCEWQRDGYRAQARAAIEAYLYPDLEALETTDTLIRIGGERFKCECGCNVFRAFRNNPRRFQCNACPATYTGAT
jgi:hypothetical protein